MAFQHIRIKNTSVSGKVPTADKIDVAELCVNLKDRKLYSKDADDNIFELGGGGAQVPGGNTPPPSGNEIGDLFFDTTLNYSEMSYFPLRPANKISLGQSKPEVVIFKRELAHSKCRLAISKCKLAM